MKKLLKFLPVLMLLFATGCGSLIPKTVEFGQDKIVKLPVQKDSEKEIQRQVAKLAADRVEQALQAALETKADAAVVTPAKEASILTDSVSRSLGPPSTPADPTVAAEKHAQRLDKAVAKLAARIEDFREDNDKNIGHKVEGTGFLQIPYFVWLGGATVFFIVLFIIGSIVWSGVKLYGIANPAVGVGVNAVQTGGRLAAKAVGQLIKGGEKFKSKLATEIPELNTELQAKIQQLFLDSHKQASDEDVRNVVTHLTT